MNFLKKEEDLLSIGSKREKKKKRLYYCPFQDRTAIPPLDGGLLVSGASSDGVPTSEINWKNSVCARSSVARETHALPSFSSRDIYVGEGPGVRELWQLSGTIVCGHKEKANFTAAIGWPFSMTARQAILPFSSFRASVILTQPLNDHLGL